MYKPTFDNTIVLHNHNAINLQMFQNEYDQLLITVKIYQSNELYWRHVVVTSVSLVDYHNTLMQVTQAQVINKSLNWFWAAATNI